MNVKQLFLAFSLLVFGTYSWAFCGFYVAKADAKLFNNTSQVILARDGNRTTVTMSSDFEGDVKDFAMVVPVPVVLKKTDIRTVLPKIFETLDAYSAPRMAEYYDQSPCHQEIYYSMALTEEESMDFMSGTGSVTRGEDKGVTIEAQYEVDEYDILILSAKESTGLEAWLIENKYKIPEGAHEVLEPYIKNNMKFFVVKVNLDRLLFSGKEGLSPIQMSFNSSKFMLPIRLGMANSKGSQDMIVYCLTQKGRVETTNYRTEKIPTNEEVPVAIQHKFGKFYKAVFDKHYERHQGKPVFLEYAWDISGNAGVKCDPCVGPPPVYEDLMAAGAAWLQVDPNDQRQNWGNVDYGSCFFTRLHVRYDRQNFPQDLQFQITPNQERFQGRYVIRHGAPKYNLDCDEAVSYIHKVRHRREKELVTLAHLTGWETDQYQGYVKEYDQYLPDEDEEDTQKNEVTPVTPTNDNQGPGATFPWSQALFFVGLAVVISVLLWQPWTRWKPTSKASI